LIELVDIDRHVLAGQPVRAVARNQNLAGNVAIGEQFSAKRRYVGFDRTRNVLGSICGPQCVGQSLFCYWSAAGQEKDFKNLLWLYSAKVGRPERSPVDNDS